jgi:hypothetical protein
MRDLPLRVLDALATALGVAGSDLLKTGAGTDEQPDLPTRLGSLLATVNTERASVAALVDATGADDRTICAALHELADGLRSVGISLARQGDQVWLSPRHAAPLAVERVSSLDLNQARLLRRIHRGEDVLRKLTCLEREVTLPQLLRAGVVRTNGRQLHLHSRAARAMNVDARTKPGVPGVGPQQQQQSSAS